MKKLMLICGILFGAVFTGLGQTRLVTMKAQTVSGAPNARQTYEIKANEMFRVVAFYSLWVRVPNASPQPGSTLHALIPELNAWHELKEGTILAGPVKIELEAARLADVTLAIAIIEISTTTLASSAQTFSIGAKIESSTNLVQWTESAKVSLPKASGTQFYRLKLSD